MQPMIVTISPEPDRTRVLMASNQKDILKAVLPPTSQAHPQAASTLLESLALWHDQRLSVVLLVDEPEGSCAALCLHDGLGLGAWSPHYDVTIAAHARRLARRRIPGVGDFRDLRQLSFGFEVLR